MSENDSEPEDPESESLADWMGEKGGDGGKQLLATYSGEAS